MPKFSIEKCFFCEKKGLRKGARMIIEKNDLNTSKKLRAASCLPCKEKEEYQITLENLSSMSGISFETFGKYDCIGGSLLAYSPYLSYPYSDGEKKEIPIGLIDRTICKICDKPVKLLQSVEEHNAECHTEKTDKPVKCTSGCNAYYLESVIESHKKKCSILCPVCKTWFAVDTGHFDKVHPCHCCPFYGCATANHAMKNELEEDEEGVNKKLEHIKTTHIWKILEFEETDD
ncbi:Hypothetical predicted protein [Cloeon dipterum]|uniref:Uncharacterized protein n=1 Tax=Cloeon dipterum TaxID=197152 RepID=A0A8S1DJ56_9INSE|nr:Hypothetical predicted protein [Cloeon dipterum]